MASRRAPGQKLVNFPAKETFIDFVDGKLPALRYPDRAQFIRDAMVEKIESTLKIKVDPDLALPPGRIGKGGAKSKPVTASDAEKQTSTRAKMGAAKFLAGEGQQGEASGHSQTTASTTDKTSGRDARGRRRRDRQQTPPSPVPK